MNNNILKKYSAPVTSIDSSSAGGWFSSSHGSCDYSHTTIIKNENYKMEVYYSDGKIVYIDFRSTEMYFTAFDGADKKQFCYIVPSDSNLEKMGIDLFVVSDYVTEPMDIEKFCSLRQRISRFFHGIISEAVRINKDSLSDSSTIIWLKEHDLYEKFIDSQALLDSLSELLLGNQVTEKQLVNLMETGELFRSEEERLDYVQRVSELQKNLSEVDKRSEDSIKLENSLKEQLERSIQEKTALVSKKNSLYNEFIKDREME